MYSYPVTGSWCRSNRAGTFQLDQAQIAVPVIIAAAPVPNSSVGEQLGSDSLSAPAGPWAPSISQGPSGDVYVYYAAYSSSPDSTGYIRADLHRLLLLGGNLFKYDGVALTHDDNICSPQGQGIENVVIMPRADAAGWRMLYAAGSSACYGWQVFSAVSDDGRQWTKEPGIRLGNGTTLATDAPQWPVGEGMQVFRMEDGTWQLIVGSFERTTPAPSNQWAITEWRSVDQLNWTYVGPVLTVRDMPQGWQGSVYSPAIREFSPGLWRMVFTADNREDSSNRSALWTAVSVDRVHWQVENELLGATGFNLYYATLVGDQIAFVRRGSDGSQVLAQTTVDMR